MQAISALSPSVGELIAAAHAAARLDAACSAARHAAQHGWCRPTLAARPGIRIDAARHPVVEEMIEYYVPNACRLEDGRRMLIITGPNMGGKSTYMRSVALIALLAWAGLFVPADAAEIGPVDRILTRIGASDDLSHGRSTFMVEMTEAAAILHQATDQSLVLMDEIGRGTSTYDGLSLAAAIAEALVSSTRSLTLFATHYFELTELSSRLREVANIHVSASQSRSGVVFRHPLFKGAEHIFKRAVSDTARLFYGGKLAFVLYGHGIFKRLRAVGYLARPFGKFKVFRRSHAGKGDRERARAFRKDGIATLGRLFYRNAAAL